MKSYTVKQDFNNVDYVELVNGDSVSIIPINPANADYQAYLRWLNGEEEDDANAQEYGETL